MENKKIKILFLDHTPFVGGAQISLVEHLKKIDKNIFEVYVACSYKAKPLGLLDIYEKINVKVNLFSFNRLKEIRINLPFLIFKDLLYLIKLVKKEKIDIIFCNTVRADIMGSLMGIFLNVKIIWFIQEFTFNKLWFRFLYPFTKKVFYVSKSVASYYQKKITKKDRVIFIWRSFSQKQIKNNRAESIKIKKELNRENFFVIGYIGRLVEMKGPQILIKAVNELLSQGIKIKCLIIGSGEGQEGNNESELKDMVNKMHISDKVIFSGYQENIIKYLINLNLLCLTSIYKEALPAIVIEAMMLNIPVIATNSGGTRELVVNEQTGLLIPPNNSNELVRSIQVIMDNKKLKNEMIKNAFDYVIKNFTTEKITKKLETEYFKIFYDK